jgi:hypothetical protein
MARLPMVGGDIGHWGTLLNEFLQESHEEDGKLKEDALLFTQNGTGAVERTVESKLQEVVSVKDFGVTGTGTETSAFQAAADAAPTVLVIPAGMQITINDTVTITYSLWMEAGAEITYAGPTDRPALIIGSGATLLYKQRHRVRISSNLVSGDWLDEAHIGVLFIDQRESDIYIDHVQGFTVGAKLLGDGSGFNYNRIFLGRLLNNKIGLRLSNVNGGAACINENLFIGGSFAVSSSSHLDKDRVGVEITSDDGQYINNNNNVFFKPSFEIYGTATDSGIEGVPMKIVHGSRNSVLRARSEQSTKSGVMLECLNQANDNEFDISYFENGVTPILKQTGTRGGNRVTSLSARITNGLPIRCSVASIIYQACPYDATQTFVRGHFIVNSSGATTHRQQTSLVLGADYLEIPNTRAVCISFDLHDCNRIVVKRRCVSSFPGRVGVALFDASSTRIDGTGLSIPSSANGSMSWNTSFGGIFRTGTDAADDLVIDLLSNTAMAYVMFIGGTAAMRLQSYEVAFISSGGLSPKATKRLIYGRIAEEELLAIQAPASGTWQAGDWVRNAAPASGQPTGWGYSGSTWVAGPNYA